jgi:hypothetical protein
MAVSAIEKPVPRAAPELDESELARLGELLERYHGFVSRAAAGEGLGVGEYAVIERLLESLWLPPSCWSRDASAWREAAGLRAAAARAGVGETRSRGATYRLGELEVLHPHLFLPLESAARFRWESVRR